MRKNRNTYYQEFDVPSSLSNPNLLKIIDFYLFNCPVAGKSVRGKHFEDYGFKGSKSWGKLKAKLLSAATENLKKNYKPGSKEELKLFFQSVEQISPPDEYCIFLKHEERTVMCSLFSAIRNALAHGSYNVKSYQGIRIYFFLNYKNYKKAQIVLQEKTLLNWVSIIQAGYSELCN